MPTLRQLREEAVLTQAELAELVGFAVTAISHWETGNKRLRAANIRSLAKAFAVRPQEVLAAIRTPQSSQKQPL